jgi:hypothetical protein
MADLDRLDIATGVDTTGLDVGLRRSLAMLDRFNEQVRSRGIQPIELDVRFRQSSVDKILSDIERVRAASAGLPSGPSTVEAPRALIAGPPTNDVAAAGNERMLAGLRASAAQLAALTAAEGEAATGAGRMAAGFAESAIQARALADASGAATPGLTRLGTAHEGLAEHGQGGARALHGVATAVTLLGTESLGATGPLVHLAESLVLFSGGLGPLLGIGVAVGALGLAYEELTGKIREGRKATDEFIDAQVKAARSRDPVGTLQEAFQGVAEPGRNVEGITDRVKRLNDELARATRGVETFDQATGGIKFTVDETAVAKIKQQIEDAKTAAREAGMGFLEPIFQATQAASRQAIQDDLSLEQQGIQARQQALQAGFAQELISRDQFFQQSRELTVAAERAAVEGLQGQLRVASAVPPGGETPGESAAREATAAHLRAEIALREQLLQLQLAQNRAQEAGQQQGVIERGLPNTLAPPVSLDIPKLDLHADVLSIDELTAAVTRMNAEETKGRLDDKLEAARREAEVLEPLLAEIGLRLKDIGNANISAGANGFADTVNSIARGVHEIGGALADVGVLSQEAARDLNDVADTFNAIAHGDIGGAIAGGIHIIGDIFGKSQTEKELEAAMKSNEAALNRATAAYERFQGKFQGAGGIAEQQAIAQRALSDPGIQKGLADKDVNEVTAVAKRLGLTWGDLRLSADTFGISLERSHHLVDGATDAWVEAMRIAAEAATSLPTDISSQQLTAENRDKLGLPSTVTGLPHSADPAVANLERIRDIELNNLNLSAAEEAKIRNLDLATAEGRKAFLEEQRSLEQRAETKGFTQEELQNFQNAQELQGIIGQAADGLNAFADATANATKNLSNVPDLQNLAEQEFRARSAFSTGQGPNDGAQLPITIGGPDRLRGIDFTPPIPAPGISESRMGLDGEKVADPITSALGKLSGGSSLKDLVEALMPTSAHALTGAQSSGRAQPLIYVTGNVNITVPGAGQPAEVARLVKAEFTREILASTGQEDLL